MGGTLSLSIDIFNGKDISVMQVMHNSGDECTIINTFYGAEAEALYKKLIDNQDRAFARACHGREYSEEELLQLRHKIVTNSI